mmetsp:Transcript_39503/g.87887  ORF Transcript_39503/g.87887 Transcript_39503/m.87887 type:complete len:658 (-) Transcript_39503:428-2401(-)|eukprot:CAMPEP_0202892806 /NCGR_PEP_ID=MMETSP1392-20130828/2497_1 /ASSEMBLY_ACC=CAM_ASM_000868 /TAXON_ID=225041 /ORGANISM="Chlamydomonas chlamydogama, Strain SAG 11-48b" /LENGTH=657 /DNA_ID=CAMNT_0049576901 /DNA_START=320 /DNA_END=2293 /DNA_ORIENTATION=-
MSHYKHRGMHHHYSGGGSPNDTNGWVEGITSLKEGDQATSLLDDDAEVNSKTATMDVSDLVAQEPASPGSGGGTAAGGKPLAAVSSGEDFEKRMEHALAVLVKEIEEVGEMVLEVGTPTGWGPVGMSREQMDVCIARLKEVAAAHASDMTLLRAVRTVELHTATGAVESQVADVLVRRHCMAAMQPAIEVRVAVIGNVDSGKSTMVGVLTRSMLDDGRGLARSKVFKYHHEESTGRTSSIGQHTLCLDGTGTILNDTSFKTQTCGDYIARAAKVITLVDLAGHEKYFRTTAFGLTGHLPDYACLIVGANMGVVGMCKEHLGVALALKVPVFFIITKVDIAPEHILRQTVQALTAILKKPGVKKKPFLVRNVDDVLLCARNVNTDSLAPIFLTSAVTGKGLELVRLFYNLIPQRQRWVERQRDLPEFVVDETFGVPGVGTVVAGTVKRGIITPNMTLLMGPDIADGTFKPVSIKSIHYKRLPVQQVVAGQTAALALKKIKRNQVRKGMVLVDERIKPKASWEFDADIAILTHSTTIQPRYQAVIHCEIVRQAARVVAMDCERLRSGDRACVRFRFIQRPEYLVANTRFVFREGKTKGIGIVMRTEHDPVDRPPAGSPAPAAPGDKPADGTQQEANGQAPAAGTAAAAVAAATASPAKA